MKRLLPIVLLLLASIIGLHHNTKEAKNEPAPDGALETYPISHVVDGDTVVIKTPTGEDKVRFIGIDAPETNVTNGAVECFGLEATEYLRYELEGEVVTLEYDPTQGERDTYGRLLAFVFLNGININQALIAGGYAREYTYDKPYTYRDSFKQAQIAAQEASVGIWSAACTN